MASYALCQLACDAPASASWRPPTPGASASAASASVCTRTLHRDASNEPTSTSINGIKPR
eukprot:7428709-Pyramimonas_sp.AAC.1